MGFSNYPNQIDGESTLPVTTDLVTQVRAEVVNRLRDAIIAAQAELGTQPSGAYGNVKDRLNAMQAQVTTIGQDLDALEAEIGNNPSGSFDTVADRLNSTTTNITNLQADLTALTIRVTDIETELGTNPSGLFSTVVARLNDVDVQLAASGVLITNLQADLTALTSRVTDVETELGTDPSGLFTTVEDRLDDVDAQLSGLSVFAEVVTPIISGFGETNSSTFVAKGAGVLNPTSLGYPAATFTLEVLLQTTDAGFDGYFELFNVTEGISVSHDLIQTMSTTPEFFTSAITIDGYDLPASQNNILEGRIRLETGAATSDRCICKYAAIRSKVT